MSIAVIPKAGEVFHGEDGTVSVVLPDKCDPNYEPTAEELEDYAEWLGINLPEEQDLMWIAREGLRSPLPDGWKACRTGDDEVYYFNFYTGESSWDHPMDDLFKRKLEEERAKLASGGRAKKQSKEAKTTGDRPLEKGAAGHVDDTKRAKGSTFAPPSSTAFPAPLPRCGRLGALGTPDAAQRIAPDVRDIVPAKSEFSLLRRTLGSVASPVSSRPAKAPEGVRDLEAPIQHRIDEEIDVQRRAMRVRHEKQLTEERAALESVQQQIRSEGDRAKRTTQADIDAAQKEYEKQYTEIKMRIKELEAKLQREKATFEAAFTQSIEQVKKEIQAEQAAAAKKQQEAAAAKKKQEAAAAKKKQEAAAAALAKAMELSAKHREETKREAEKLVETAKKESEEEQKKRLDGLREELAKELASAKNVATAVGSAAEEETALQKVTADAATALDAIRHEYSEKEAELRALKEQALLEKKKKKASLKAESTKATLDAEEQRLRKAMEERLTRYANETQRLVLEREKTNCSTAQITASGPASQTAAMAAPTEEDEEEEERGRCGTVPRQLDAKHTEAMGRLRGDHAHDLHERHLLDPHETPVFGELIYTSEHAWLAENPSPRRGDEAMHPMSPKESQAQEVRLAAMAESLAAEVKAAAAAHRTQRLQEVNAQIAQYRAEQQQRVLHAQQQQQQQQEQQRQKEEAEAEEEEVLVEDDDDDDGDGDGDSKMTARISPSADEVPVAEAVRREEELRARLCVRIDALQSAVQLAREQQQQQQQQQIKQHVPIERPPPAPTSIFSTPVMNRTLSTIPPVQSFWSSARPSPVRPIPLMNPTIQSIPQEAHQEQRHHEQQQQQQQQQEEHEHGARQQLETRNAVYEDRLRRTALVLHGRRRELRGQLVQMEHAREAWLRDMRSCRERHDRQHIFLLRQIKSALEKRARALNREVLELKRASAWLRARELCHQRTRTPVGGGSGCGDAVELLEGMLARTEQLESFIGAGRRQQRTPKEHKEQKDHKEHRDHKEHKEHRDHKEHREHREHSRHTRRARSLEKTWKHRYTQPFTHYSGGDAAVVPLSVWADESEGVTRWLMEQQLSV